MKTEDILALLGRKSTDEAIESLFKELGVRRRPELDEEEEEICAWIPIRRLGIEFGFEDESHFKALDKPIGMLPLLFTQVIFYNEREDILPYKGDLPYKLDFKDNQGVVREKMKQFDSFRRSYIRDVWDLPEHRIVVEYSNNNTQVSSIICELRGYASPMLTKPMPASLSIDELVNLFGIAPNDPGFLDTFRPFGIDDCKEELKVDWEADFRHEYGFEIRFDESMCGAPKTCKKKLGMTSITFFGDRVFNARGWIGELPFGLSFDDDQNAMFAKIVKKPAKHSDHWLDGYALWNFERFSLKILYSNMENRLFRITIIAPWYLEEVEED